MAKRILRRSLACLAVAGVLGLALLPPEHIHETRAGDGHPSALLHSHFEPHQPVGADSRVGAHDDVLWVSSLFTSPNKIGQVYPLNQFIVQDLPVPQPAQTSPSKLQCVQLSVHDPPWVTSHGLRGPPTLLV